jgi:hypothetical protein
VNERVSRARLTDLLQGQYIAYRELPTGVCLMKIPTLYPNGVLMKSRELDPALKRFQQDIQKEVQAAAGSLSVRNYRAPGARSSIIWPPLPI